jgi:hypothetical protein
MGKTAISFLPLESEQSEGGRWRGCGRPAPIPGEPGHGGGRAVVQNEEDSMGVRFPYLSLVVVACRGVFPGGGGLEGRAWGAVFWYLREKGSACGGSR